MDRGAWRATFHRVAKSRTRLSDLACTQGTSQLAQLVRNPPANAGDRRDKGLIPGLGRSPGEGNDNPLQYSCLENSVDKGTWWAIVHRVTKSRKSGQVLLCFWKELGVLVWETIEVYGQRTHKLKMDWNLTSAVFTHFLFFIVPFFSFPSLLLNYHQWVQKRKEATTTLLELLGYFRFNVMDPQLKLWTKSSIKFHSSAITHIRVSTTIQITWCPYFFMLFSADCSSCYCVIFPNNLASSQIKFYSLKEHHFHGSYFLAN